MAVASQAIEGTSSEATLNFGVYRLAMLYTFDWHYSFGPGEREHSGTSKKTPLNADEAGSFAYLAAILGNRKYPVKGINNKKTQAKMSAVDNARSRSQDFLEETFGVVGICYAVFSGISLAILTVFMLKM
ncbi:unnamed protein product [Fusarium graminearum]|nr:unnamed protein product [Fusarium graminearum]